MCNLRESLIHVISLCLCVSNWIHLLFLAFKESVVKVGSGWHRCFWLRIRLLTPWVLQWKHARSVVSLLFGLEATIFYDFERYPLGGALRISHFVHCGGLKQPAVMWGCRKCNLQNSCFPLDGVKAVKLKKGLEGLSGWEGDGTGLDFLKQTPCSKRIAHCYWRMFITQTSPRS